MVIIFIVILVIVGIFAITFNIWNIRNPVGKGKKQNNEYSMENLQYINRQNNIQYKEHNERILKMFNSRSAV